MLGSRLPPTVCAHANLDIGGRCFVAGVYAGTTVIALEEPQPEIGLGIRLAFKMVSKPQTPITNLDKRGLNGEPRLAAGVAADDGGRHGESD